MKNKFKLETMDLLPAIDEATEILLFEVQRVMKYHNIHLHIIYLKETGQFMLKLLSRNKYFKKVFKYFGLNLNDETVEISQDNIIIEDGHKLEVNRVDTPDIYNQIVEIKENGWTHPLVDEWESIGILK